MDCQQESLIMCTASALPCLRDVPRRPRASILGCKRRLDFNDSIIHKRRANDKLDLARNKCLKNVPILGTVENEMQDAPKEKECVDEPAVVGPKTPSPATRKCASSKGGFTTRKIRRSKSKAVIKLTKANLQEVSELAEYSYYYTRAINQQLLNTIKLIECQGASIGSSRDEKVSQKPSKKEGTETCKAWRELMKTAIAESCGTTLEDESQLFHGRIQFFLREVGAVQGQRVYFPWKGSVLDSVIGAFLTQRVSDNFSSSAFMSLGVSFPQYRDCDAYSRHHRMLRENRSNAARPCQNKCTKENKLKFGAESWKPFDKKKIETSRKGRVLRKGNLQPEWNTVRRQYSGNMESERSIDSIDYVDWHAVRRADVKDISDAIVLRGMNKKLAKRIKEFLDRLVMDHGNLDLEWIRSIPPIQAKEFLLSIYGLGLKSAQCVQLLTLNQPAFPVDVNVARVTVRLGWVPAPPNTSDELQMSVLEEVSKIHDLINQYLWPRLCKVDEKTLYELHYHMITFGKVFCTKQKPNCAECPMRRDCKYYTDNDIEDFSKTLLKAQRELLKSRCKRQKDLEKDPEYICLEGGVVAPKTPSKDESVLNIRRQRKVHKEISSLSGRQHNKTRTRTQHFVYELPDWHPVLEMFDNRDPDDSSPYLLVTWESGQHGFDKSGDPLAKSTRSSSLGCISGSLTVPGTVMIPCRTALRGKFPLNGTYFQINEVFADQKTSEMPIDVRCKTLQQLPKKTLYCGHDLSNIVKGLSADEVKSLFNEGYICTRGFDRKTSASFRLEKRLHAIGGKKRELKQ